jgi:DNA-binding GntR family transcriptional regulator
MADIHTHLVDALASGDVDESARLFAAHARGDLREQEQPAEKRR